MALLEEGTTIRDTYVVERLIGEGAFAEVYRVKHKFLGRQAMKVLKQPGLTELGVTVLLREATLLSQIGHKNIVRVFDANSLEADGAERGYFTMEYVAAGTLEEYMARRAEGLLPAETAVEIVAQAAEGLAVAHAQKPPIVHRDLKPQNILVQEDHDGLKVKISDFGLAQEVNPLTFMTAAAGTLSFKAPEAVFEGGVDSKASDIWSLGVILYLLLTERLPYPAPTQWGWSSSAFKNPHRPASTLNVDANEALDSIVGKCLKVEPHQRYAKVGTLLSDLRRWKPTRTRPARLRATDTAEKGFSPPAAAAATDSTPDEAKRLVAQAIQLANAQQLAQAAQIMEDAMRLHPELRATHARRAELWRKGLAN